MSLVFQNIDPHPLSARRVCTPPPLWGGEGDTIAGQRGGGWGVNILEDSNNLSTYVSSPGFCKRRGY
jgi:hypothetical protein